MTLPPLPEPLVMVNRYGVGASTSDGDGGVFTADQMREYASAAVQAEREACAKVCDTLISNWRQVMFDAGQDVLEAYDSGRLTALHNVATAIRARKEEV